MKRTLLASVAAGAMFVGASITGPTLHTAFVTPSFAQDDTGTDTEEVLPEEETQGTDTQEEPAEGTDTGTDAGTDTGTDEPATEEPAAEEPAADEPAAEDPAAEEPAAEEPAAEEPAAEEPAAEEPAAEEPAADEPPAEEPAADDAATSEGQMFIDVQGENEVSANTYIGQALYNMQDESIGNINDLIFSDEGGVTTAVVGVGGFLGIGQKNVGVNFDMIEIQQQPDSADVRLVIEASREQLESAPEYVTLEEQVAEEQANQPPATGTGTAPAPAPAQ